MKIKDLCETERPRERMSAQGAASLGNAELLAILLRSGSAGMSAVELAQHLLKLGEGKLSALFNMPVEKMRSISGIGPCKATTIQAALELGRRFMGESSGLERKPIVTARMVFDKLYPKYKGLDHEECWVLFLNHHNYAISTVQASFGGGSSTVVDVARIARLALEKGASGIILTHNHPSGNPRPSKADMQQTEALHKACKALQIELVDHVVVADDSFFSFSEDKMYMK